MAEPTWKARTNTLMFLVVFGAVVTAGTTWRLWSHVIKLEQQLAAICQGQCQYGDTACQRHCNEELGKCPMLK